MLPVSHGRFPSSFPQNTPEMQFLGLMCSTLMILRESAISQLHSLTNPTYRAIIWMMHHIGFQFTFLVGSGGLALGSWLRYIGSRTSPPNYALTMVGQVILGITGAIPLSLPSHYTNLWFNGNGKVAANAIMSLANPTGAAVCFENSSLTSREGLAVDLCFWERC